MAARDELAALDTLRNERSVTVADHATKNTIVDAMLAEIKAKQPIAEEDDAECERLREQEPSEENEQRPGIEAALARFEELNAIQNRTPAEEWELRYLEPLAALASYPRFLKLVAIPEQEERRPRTDAEEIELRELAEWLSQNHGPKVLKSIRPRLAGPVIAAIRAKSTAAPRRAARGVSRPRERRSSSRQGSRASPDDGDSDPPHHLERRVRASATCAHCGAGFVPARSDARYCSNAHRQAAYRRRRRVTDNARPTSEREWAAARDLIARARKARDDAEREALHARIRAEEAAAA